MAEKSVNEISRDVRQVFQKGNDALTRENYDYAVELLMQVLEKEPGFYEGRKALRTAQQRKAGGGSGFFKKAWSSASSTPLMPSIPGESKGVPSWMAPTQFLVISL